MAFVQADGLAFHVADSGGRERPAIVFSNSLGSDFRIWDAVVDRLKAAGRRVAVADVDGDVVALRHAPAERGQDGLVVLSRRQHAVAPFDGGIATRA